MNPGATRMIACRRLLLLCVAVLAGSSAVRAAAREQVPDIYASIRRQAMIFFVAKGEPGACGAGCSEWIAAEGMIDRDAAQRLRDFIGGLQRRDLPIFFNSMGGLAGPAVALGVVMREQRMTAGVGRTMPEGCRGSVATDDACRRVIQSKRELKARLATGNARCLSACAYALVGASVRRVARDAQLGVHTLRMPAGASPQGAQPSIADAHHLLKRYMIEMGVDPALIDVAAKVSADRVRTLSREEIARFGIEARDVYETPWVPYEDVSKRFYVLKAVTQATATDGTDFRTSLLRVGCKIGDRVPILLRRELLASEIGAGAVAVVKVAVGDGTFSLDGRVTKGAIEVRYGAAGAELFQNAVTVPHIIVAEAPAPAGNAPGSSRVIKFSTRGLSKALDELQKDCGGSKVPDDAALRRER
jgi:hypothetical protein